MITVWGEGRGFRVVWLLEEMGLAYRLRPVDLQAGVEEDAEFQAINPAGFIPAIQDGDVTMVESIAISGSKVVVRAASAAATVKVSGRPQPVPIKAPFQPCRSSAVAWLVSASRLFETAVSPRWSD